MEFSFLFMEFLKIDAKLFDSKIQALKFIQLINISADSKNRTENFISKELSQTDHFCSHYVNT